MLDAAFDLEPLERFSTGQTSIRRPREFAYFSYNDRHELRSLSAESLSYYYPPIFQIPWGETRPIDLSTGFESFVQRDDSIEEHLDGLLDTLQVFEENLLQRVRDEGGDIRDVRIKADVITWRGMMTKILTAAFDLFNEFEMDATLFQVRHLDYSPSISRES
nr:decapping nuclease rai1 [Quercus suber]